MKRIVIKIGTNILTRGENKLDYNLISDVVSQLSELWHQEYEIILVSSGAVGIGKRYCSAIKEKDPIIKKQIFASIGQAHLFQLYADQFSSHNIYVAQALINKNNFKSKESYKSILNTLNGLLHNKVIPIINENDVVSEYSTTFGDNDQLAALTASLVQADWLILLTNVDGLYASFSEEKKTNRLIKEITKIDNDTFNLCKKNLSTDGTGGMYSKLKAAEIATNHGIKVTLCKGNKKNIILNILAEKKEGTFFYPQRKIKFSSKGAWMNSCAEFTGEIIIDDGAIKAIKSNKSLLAVGIKDFSGHFKKGEVIVIKNEKKIRIGVGLALKNADQLEKLIREKKTQGQTIIHTDNLFIL